MKEGQDTGLGKGNMTEGRNERGRTRHEDSEHKPSKGLGRRMREGISKEGQDTGHGREKIQQKEGTGEAEQGTETTNTNQATYLRLELVRRQRWWGIQGSKQRR